MSDLRERAPATALMEKLVSLRGTPDLIERPFGIVQLSADGVGWLRGIRGELKVAAQLDRLGSEWTILHSVLVGPTADIDHIAIGPQGVFCINSKRLLEREIVVKGDDFRVSGHKREYLQRSDYEATRVEKVLRGAGIPVNVIPVIAVSGAKSVKVRVRPTYRDRKIGVVAVQRMLRRILKQPIRLTSAQRDAVVVVLSDSRHWTRSTSTATIAETRSAYERIERGVNRWIAAWLILLVIAAVATGVFEYNWIAHVIF